MQDTTSADERLPQSAVDAPAQPAAENPAAAPAADQPAAPNAAHAAVPPAANQPAGPRPQAPAPGDTGLRWLLLMLAGALALRVILATHTAGYLYDTNTFTAWAAHLAEVGPGRFYADGYFADYPPGYMYVLWAAGSLCRALGLAVSWDGSLGGAAVSTGAAASAGDLYWLSRIISAESQGESLTGQIAVGNVVLNRVASSDFPDTIRAVVFDTRDGVQFEPVSNGTVYDEPTAQSVAAARAALSGTSVVGKCLYFYAPALSQGTWIRTHRTYYTTIGCHRFYL